MKFSGKAFIVAFGLCITAFIMTSCSYGFEQRSDDNTTTASLTGIT
jgi:hypothetical protein